MAGHTLVYCPRIDNIYLNQQYNEKANEGRASLTLYLNRLHVPTLKRLTRSLGGVMTQTKSDLVKFCLVRATPVLRRVEETLVHRPERPNVVEEVIRRVEETLAHRPERPNVVEEVIRRVEDRRRRPHVIEEDTHRLDESAQRREDRFHLARNRECDGVDVELRQYLPPYANVGERSIVLRMMLNQINRLIRSFTENNLDTSQHTPAFSRVAIDFIVSASERGEVIEENQIARIHRVSTIGLPSMNSLAQTHMRIRSYDLKRLIMRINEHITPVFTMGAIGLSCLNIENKYWNDWYSHITVAPLPTVEQIVSLPTQSYPIYKSVSIKKGETVVMEEDCCICMNSNSYIETGCHHVFCNCILHHLVKNGVKCPICRQDITTLLYGQPTQYESTLRILPLINSGNIRFIIREPTV